MSSNNSSNEESVTMNSASINGTPLIVLSSASPSSSDDDVHKNIDSLKSEESSLYSSSHNDNNDDNDSNIPNNERKSFEVIRGRALDLSSPSLMNPDAEKTSKIVYVTAPPNSTTIPTVRPKVKSFDDDLSDVSMDDTDFDTVEIARNREGIIVRNEEGTSKKECMKVST